jgi:hypothetical protein
MNTHADKTSENKSQAVANSLSKQQCNSESAFHFVGNRPVAIAQRKLQEMANNSPRVAQLKALQEMANNASKVIQRRPTLPTQIEDHEFVALLTSGRIVPISANIRDERSRRDGTPQLLTMLEYAYQDLRVYVHIHTAEGTYFGHINIDGGGRLPITSGQAAVILRIAQESGIPTRYSGAGGNQDWELGELGHERK